MRTVYVNGRFIPEAEATISIFDRGYLFSDSVYEVTACVEGHLVDSDAHIKRLFRSLGALDIQLSMTAADLEAIQNQLLKTNGVIEGIVYIQVSRGTAERDFLWPPNLLPNIVMFTQNKKLCQHPLAGSGARIITAPDLRWKRRDIKTTSLLAQSMAKSQAAASGYDDVWMVEDEKITEGSSTNAFIITSTGQLKTQSISSQILNGVTRLAVLEIASKMQMEIVEQAFSVSEALAAREAFATGTTFFVLPIVEINSMPIGDGNPGPITAQIRQRYIELALTQTNPTTCI